MPPRAVPPRVVPLPRFRSAMHHAAEHQVPPHNHDATELVYTREGDLTIHVAGQALHGRAGTLFILPAHIPHDQLCHGRWHTLCVLFQHGTGICEETPRTLELGDDALVGRWFEDLCALHESRAGIAENVFDGFLFTLLNRVSDIEDKRRSEETLHPRLADAVRYLHDHVTEEIGAGALAGAACVSYSHLSALFRERFACGPLKHHQNLRMEMARKLLLNPYLSIDEVARKTGFEDTNYFVRLFRKTQGAPPGKWRRTAGTAGTAGERRKG